MSKQYTMQQAVDCLEGYVGLDDVFLASGFLPENKDIVSRREVMSALIAFRRERDINHVSLLTESCGGVLNGLEAKHKNRDAWVALMGDASSPGQFRIQYFDAKGFSGHSTFNTIEEALQAAVIEGYIIPDQGAMDHLAQADTWTLGMIATHEAQQSWSPKFADL